MPSRSKKSSLVPRGGSLSLTGVCAALLVAGCAQLPEMGPAPILKGVDAFLTADSFKAPAANWPQDHWWSAYGDSQLDSLIEEALAGSPDMAAASARLQQAEALTRVAGSAGKPQASANASVTEDKLSYNYLTPSEVIPRGWNDYGRATLDLRWELDFWGKNRAALAAATSELEASRAELAQARLLLASGIAANYAELSRLYANRETAEKSVELRSKTAALFAERFKNGLENQGGAREADARLAAAEGALLALDEQIALQRNRLAALLGAGPDRGLKIAKPVLKFNRAFGLPEQAGADLLGRRPDVVAARLVADAQASRIDQKKAEFYPNVNLMAFVGVQSLGINMLDNSGSAIGSVGPAISLPIFTAGRLQGELRGAQARYAQAVANYNGTVSRAMQEVADAAVSQKSLGQRLEKAQQAVGASTEAYRVAGNRYEGGLANYLEVLVAEDGLLNNMNVQTNLRSLSFTHDIALKRALGGGYQVAQR
ncbi:efflux transporter outer membrane subunit [Noviherbaspirillum saxi]|uniref:Efflux transporter outer membrane subunit n=1 Tax=Noviherbaspirillum saxi TaxID=2320863 RepID=A0A3A3FM97_9BURK|nr:efflux transporter outer membrane subunit [Noviherbaspirillum saxi]RJF92465.1 efflux transporter outer membrane subunit [Noviherbaspirillum saxi]